MSFEMPAGATLDQYESWCGEASHNEPRICLTAGCFEPMTMLSESGDCVRHAIEGCLYELSRETDPNTRMDIVTQLIELG